MPTPQDAPEAPLVLLVDDDADLTRLLGSALRNRGLRVMVAPNGAAGLDAVRREVPRLIVLDYWMPVLDGVGFLSGLREMLAAVPPVVLLSATQDAPMLGRDLGVDACVEKPLRVAPFVQLCEALLSGGRKAAPSDPRVLGSERRVHERRVCRRTVVLRMPHGERRAAFAANVSEGGLCLEVPGAAPPLPGAYVGLDVELTSGRRIELQARVRYSFGDRVGLQFLVLDQANRDAVDALLLDTRAAEG